MTAKPDPQPALDATVSAPGVTPRRSGEAARAAATPGGAGPDASVGAPGVDHASAETLRPGDTLGRYVLGESVGAGGMGRVFRAKDPDLGREVAIKVLHVGGDGSGGALERRLLREAQAMATLSHDNLASVYDIGVSDGRVFVAMELVDGSTLRALIADRTRTWRDKLAAVITAGRGLAAAHSAGVIHRDFKPDNVLIARNGRVKVVDFGLARAEPEPTEASSGRPGALPADLSANLTQTGALLGTPAYMAPEQHAGQIVDARADQFAFAVTAWEAVYGQRPFPSDAYASLVAAVCAHDLTPPPRGTGVPPALEAVLRRALASEARGRFTSMDALLAAIEAAIRPRRRGQWLAAGATAALAIGGLVTYAVTRDRSPATASVDRTTATVGRAAPTSPTGARRTVLKRAAIDLADMARAAASDEDDRERVVMTRIAQAQVVNAHHAEALACYERAGLRHAGTIVIEYDLDPAGMVLDNRALEDGLGSGVGACLLAASRGWRFPAAPDGKPTTVRFPFAFEPDGSDRDPRAPEADLEGGVRIVVPPLPGLPEGLDLPMPIVPPLPAPPTPPTPPAPAVPAPAAPPVSPAAPAQPTPRSP